MQNDMDELNLPKKREPIFNLPRMIVLLAVCFLVIHLIRTNLLDGDSNLYVMYYFSFVPAAFGDLASKLPKYSWTWTWITYSFLHGDWAHLAMNSLWMLAFGSPVAKRLGWFRFILITLATSMGGAVAHYISHPNEVIPMIGASGIVSGYMGAAARFAFTGQGSRSNGMFEINGKALSLIESFQNRTFLAFLGIWFVINFATGFGIIGESLAGGAIAWEAHIGGFLTGLLLFSLFDNKNQTL